LLFLALLMLGAFSARRAKLRKFDFAFDFLFVLLAPVVDILTLLARKFDEAVL